MNAKSRTIFLLLLFLLAAPLAAAGSFSEYQVKAAFLHNFGKYVSWPAKAFDRDPAHFVIGILGDDPFGEAFAPILRKTVQNRSVELRHLAKASEAYDCQVVFISRSEQRRLGEILAALEHRTTLTVSDIDNFTDQGGMIQLLLEDNHVRFSINLQASRKAGLGISSNMLRLATGILE